MAKRRITAFPSIYTKHIRNLLTAAIATLSMVALGAVASVASAQQNSNGEYGCGPGSMGPGMMGGGMGSGLAGPGMMGYGSGRGGYRSGSPPTNLDLSVADVKGYLQRWIQVSGNPHVKVGSVVAKDKSTIIAEIVTDTGALVERFRVDRQTGRYVPIE